MKIYTKTGDDGNTGLQGDFRIAKSHPRILAYGTVDEANAMIGVVLSNVLDDDVREVLNTIQNELFLLGSDLSNQNLNDLKNRISLERKYVFIIFIVSRQWSSSSTKMSASFSTGCTSNILCC